MKNLKLYTSHSEYQEPTDLPNVSYCQEENEVHCSPVPDYSEMYLTFESLEDSNNIFFKSSYNITITIQVSSDNGNSWTSYTSTTGNGTIIATLNSGERILLKGNRNYYAVSLISYTSFNSTKDFKVYGNIMSLISENNFKNSLVLNGESTFLGLFWNCTHLKSVNNLILPATTLSKDCYSYMFYKCSGISKAPVLIAEQLVFGCYSGMFQDCSSLNYIKMMATDISANSCLGGWVQGVSSTGTFVKNSAAEWNVTGDNGIPEGWTVETASA